MTIPDQPPSAKLCRHHPRPAISSPPPPTTTQNQLLFYLRHPKQILNFIFATMAYPGELQKHLNLLTTTRCAARNFNFSESRSSSHSQFTHYYNAIEDKK